MSGLRIKQKDWVLTRDALDKFLYWLDPDRDRAGHRHNRIHHGLCIFLAARGCTDAGSLADETINRVARQIDEGKGIDEIREKPVKPETYIYAVAKNVLREYYDHPDQKKKAPLDDLAIAEILRVDPWKDLSEDMDQEKRIACVEQCLQKLELRNREIILRYYKGSKQGEAKRNREEMARELGIKKTKLAKQVMNIKDGLRVCVSGCVEPVGAE